MRLSWGRYWRTGLVSIGRTDRLLEFSGDDDSLRRSTFHEACGAGWAVAQRLPSDGYDAEGTLRFSQTSLRRQVCRDCLYIVLRDLFLLLLTKKNGQLLVLSKLIFFLVLTKKNVAINSFYIYEGPYVFYARTFIYCI